MVRQSAPGIGKQWERAPLPILIVEVFSPFSRRRDQTYKKDFYMNARVPEYWMVDPEQRQITVVRPDEPDQAVSDGLVWHPFGASEPLTIRVAEIFL